MSVEVRIYTTARCGYCRAAKTLLEHRGARLQEIDCSDDAELRHWLGEQTGQRTVPQIFLAGVAIGGYAELAELDRSGELAQILAGSLAPRPVL